ncbi:hypothetical protein EVAR_13146_1 [Eumeta japonica]|uniref:Uncharacterized protein n=1 Tax=Eumeta variegata TaxID=151549 RepID=A0A4C1U9P2_EUMVA|nr:hypothetical protein EVAR_13146_1 [Eumeta japonica]
MSARPGPAMAVHCAATSRGGRAGPGRAQTRERPLVVRAAGYSRGIRSEFVGRKPDVWPPCFRSGVLGGLKEVTVPRSSDRYALSHLAKGFAEMIATINLEEPSSNLYGPACAGCRLAMLSAPRGATRQWETLFDCYFLTPKIVVLPSLR